MSDEHKPEAECAVPIPGRRVVSASVAGVQNNPGTQCNWVTTAVCDDGSIWCIRDNDTEWWELPSIPQTSGTTKDRTAAERQKRYRQRMALRRDAKPLQRDVTPTQCDVTEAQAQPVSTPAEAAVEGAPAIPGVPEAPAAVFHVEQHAGFPDSAIRAAMHADFVGCPAEFAVKTWNLAESRGGRDSKDVPIRSFRHHLATAWTYEQERNAKQEIEEQQAKETKDEPTVWKMKTSMEAKLAEIADLRRQFAYEPAGGGWKWDHVSRPEVKKAFDKVVKLNAEAKALKAKISESA